MEFTKLMRTHFWLLIVAVALPLMIYFVFISSRFWSCLCGLIIAFMFFLLRKFYQKLYGASEVVVGLFVLYQSYPQGRGAFSSGFNDGFQTFRWNIVLISTVTAVYIIVRGFDNLFNPRNNVGSGK